MWKDSEQAKRQKMAEWAGGQLGGKVVVGLAVGSVVGLVVRLAIRAVVGVATKSAAAIGEKIIKWDKEALDALFNKTIKYSVINNYIFTITKLYTQQSKGKALLLLRGAKLSVILESVHHNKDRI